MSDANPAQPDYDAELDGLPVADDPEGLRARLPLEVLASKFADELRQGQRPTIDDYAARYPKLAEEIRDFFPMVLAMERWKSEREANCLRKQLPKDFSIQQLGNYRLLREIGRGGMGVVFEGRRGQSNARVAVKLLPWKVAAVPRWRDRFEREARTVSALRHKHIVPVFEFGEHEGYCYFIMQFIEGVSLDWIIGRLKDNLGVVYADEIVHVHKIEEHPPDAAPNSTSPSSNRERGLRRGSWKGIATIAIQSAQALHYAHSEGTLHNDIKPANLLLDAKGHVWVTDFGVAQPLDRELQADDDTDDGRLTGTLRFMAPERFEGAGDERSDVYSLGATLYELVTLQPAFGGQRRLELIETILRGGVTTPRLINASIPRDLEFIILKALQADPSLRYSSAGELAADLLCFVNGQKIRKRRRSWIPFRRAP